LQALCAEDVLTPCAVPRIEMPVQISADIAALAAVASQQAAIACKDKHARLLKCTNTNERK
jgi:hypothetical protein